MSPTDGPDGPVAAATAHLRALWAQDRPAFGLWSVVGDPFVAELLAGTGFDAVVLDVQHGLATTDMLPGLCQAMRSAGRAPVVRVPWNDPAVLMRTVDAGAHAVVVPMVSSAAEAERAARACRFPPRGDRSWGPMWGAVRADGALPPEDQDDALLVMVMVETRAGVDALEEIVAVPGVDGVFVGPNDLALGCGHGRATYRDSPAVDALLERVATVCREAGVVAGMYCSDAEMARHWADRGYRFLTAATDAMLLRDAADGVWEGLSSLIGRGGPGTGTGTPPWRRG